MPITDPSIQVPSEPAAGRFCRMLKDGYWDRTEVIELADGSRRVRKRTKGASAPGLWGLQSLRREIHYLATLPPGARGMFPSILALWDRDAAGGPDIGYEMAYYPSHVDAGELARRGFLAQEEVNAFEDALAEAVLGALHQPLVPEGPLSSHIAESMRRGWTELEADNDIAALIDAEVIELNGCRMAGPRAAFERIVQGTDAWAALDRGPCVRLHGDLFLENILWGPAEAATGTAALILLDPVSVAGVWCGTPLFDLVKYESYATGELLALRSAWVEVEGFGGSSDPATLRGYRYRVRWEEPALQPFRSLDWHCRFRRAYESKYGPVDPQLYRLIDGYFGVVMAVNTSSEQRRARLLKATADFNAVIENS